MKKALPVMLALMLVLSFGLSRAELPAEVPGTVDVPYAGFRFVPPDVFQGIAGAVSMDSASEIADGVWCSVWTYYAMTDGERTAWRTDRDPDAPVEYRVCPLFMLLSLGNGMTFRSFNAAFAANSIPAEFVREIGRAGDWTFYLYMEGPNADFIAAIDPEYREEYAALANAADDVAAAFMFFEPQEQSDPFADLVGSRLEFTAADFNGNPVASADLFAQNEITVLNCWTTWCDPCIAELPYLRELHDRLRESGCGVVGLLLDDDVDAARRLIAENGVAWPVLFAPDTFAGTIGIEAVPTTIFVGRDGTVLAPPVVGAHPDEYETALESLLPR